MPRLSAKWSVIGGRFALDATRTWRCHLPACGDIEYASTADHETYCGNHENEAAVKSAPTTDYRLPITDYFADSGFCVNEAAANRAPTTDY